MFEAKVTYSQTGEDRIIEFLFQNMLGRDRITYLDIGANDPVRLSNTYLLYRYFGNKKGVLVDANPLCVKRLKAKRRKDECVNVGIGTESSDELTFYLMKSDVLSTFSLEEAKHNENLGDKIIDTIQVPVITINELHDRYFDRDEDIDFLSIDIEGMDIDVVRTIEFDRWKPYSICIEASEVWGDRRPDYNDIVQFLDQKGYLVFGGSWINTIFVRKDFVEEYRQYGMKCENDGNSLNGRIQRGRRKLRNLMRKRLILA